MEEVCAKSTRLGMLLMDLVAQGCPDLELITPVSNTLRGSQVSFRHPEAYVVMQALIAPRVVGDFRTPDTIRFGTTPLYLRFTDLWKAATTLADILKTGVWQDEKFQTKSRVT